MLTPSLDEYRRQTQGVKAMPVYVDRLADLETPLSAFWKLASDETVSFLLESVTGGERLARYSFIGVRPKATLFAKNGSASLEKRGERTEVALNPDEDILDLLRREAGIREVVPVPELPEFIGGAVGLLSYDLVRVIERLPDANPDDLSIPDIAMMVTDTVVAFDHAKNVMHVIALADGTDEGYALAETNILHLLHKLDGPMPSLPESQPNEVEVGSTPERAAFEEGVRRIKRYIEDGDCIQVVPSLRFEVRTDSHPVTVYRALRSINPSPYMFLLRFGAFDLVGASPELLVSLHGREAHVRPIAGTRHRAKNPDEDEAIAQELLADPKERAEHIMLVDLGRNDLGRVSKPGSVQVREIMTVERYSHVMHIVSDVVGELTDDMDAVDLVRATFPAGTVSGAPKIRAMEIIDEVERTRRGSYAGAVGSLSVTGDLDMCIVIRTILMQNGAAYVQAGAGIVADSDPAREYEECSRKARASIRALEAAAKGLGAAPPAI